MSDAEAGLFIDGAWVPSSSGESIPVLNAATEEVIESVALGSAQDADRAVRAARSAFDSWARTPLEERMAVVRRALDLLSVRAEQIALTVANEVGTPLVSARTTQVELALNDVRLTLDAAEVIDWEQVIGNSLVVREPVGVVAAITPWNYPLHQACAKVAPALVAGCTVVLKPSEMAPLTSYLLATALHEAGLPPGVFNLVPGTGPEVGHALASHAAVDMVSLTGSVGAGSAVMHAAADGIRRVALELGGKSSMVVLDDAPLEAAVNRAVASCFSNNGQMCSAITRLLVPAHLAADAHDLAAAAAASYVVGDPLDPSTTTGPLISHAQQERVRGYIRVGIDEGATLVSGGDQVPNGLSRGFYVTPTVLGDVAPSMRVAQEEIFGPVLVVIPYRDDEDAVEIANGTDFGLSGAVWSGDNARAEAIARRMRTGQVSINGGAFNPAAPFGGYKKSGIGRELGVFGLEEFLETKAMHR